MSQYLSDFAPSELDRYRKLASFEWKLLKVFLNTEEAIKLEQQVYEELKKYPIMFDQYLETPNLDELRRITTKKIFIMKHVKDKLLTDIQSFLAFKLVSECVSTILDLGMTVKFRVTFSMFLLTIRLMGTEKHQQFVDMLINGDIFACFCLTEVAHGSNVRGMRTTATYNKDLKQFILHTPDFEAAKCWAGSLGQTATHAMLFAQLITSDGNKHGVHPFVVCIRDPKTMVPHPRIKIVDMGEKIGLDGIDNGYIMFDQFPIPKDALLNKLGDVTEDGKYINQYQDGNKRHAASLGTISQGRIGIITYSNALLFKALTITVRYAAIREKTVNTPLLECQSFQHNILPYLAAAYALKIFSLEQYKNYHIYLDSLDNQKSNTDFSELGLEIHVVSSAAKPYSTWLIRDGLKACVEACGDHGCLAIVGLSDLMKNQESNCTYEGENHVLIQQNINWLLKLWPLAQKGRQIRTPLNYVNFLNNSEEILRRKFLANTVEDVMAPEFLITTFEWLVCYLLKSTYEKFNDLMSYPSQSEFSAKNKIQVYFGKTTATVYIEYLVLKTMIKKIHETNEDQLKNVLLKLFSLFGCWCLEKRIPTLYLGGYAENSNAVNLIRSSILKLCKNLKNDAVALADVEAAPDFAINSIFGASDGEVYKRLESYLFRGYGSLSRPEWWQEIVDIRKNFKSNL